MQRRRSRNYCQNTTAKMGKEKKGHHFFQFQVTFPVHFSPGTLTMASGLDAIAARISASRSARLVRMMAPPGLPGLPGVALRPPLLFPGVHPLLNWNCWAWQRLWKHVETRETARKRRKKYLWVADDAILGCCRCRFSARSSTKNANSKLQVAKGSLKETSVAVSRQWSSH
jgi:hypothetical protein